MGKPHIHAELIKQWADGARIEFSRDGKFWISCSATYGPEWNENYFYRIKPEEKKPVVRWLWAFKYSDTDRWNISTQYMSDVESEKILSSASGHQRVRLEWSRTEFPE